MADHRKNAGDVHALAAESAVNSGDTVDFSWHQRGNLVGQVPGRVGCNGEDQQSAPAVRDNRPLTMVDSGSPRPPVRPTVVTAVHGTLLGEAVPVSTSGWAEQTGVRPTGPPPPRARARRA